MSKYRINARVDANELQIKNDLIRMGCIVESGHDDILVEYSGSLYQVEVKKCSPFQKNGTLKIGMIKDSQFKKLCTRGLSYLISWNATDIFNYITKFETKNIIYKDNFFVCYKKWLSDKELKRLRSENIIQDGH